MSVHSTGQSLLEVTPTSSRGLTNNAHNTGVVSKKGNCTKELVVQFLSSTSSDQTERTRKEELIELFLGHMLMCGRIRVGVNGKSWQ
jgi:hypothetical protein